MPLSTRYSAEPEFQSGYYVAIYDASVTEVKITDCVEQLGPRGMIDLIQAWSGKLSPHDRAVMGGMNVTLLARLVVENHCVPSLPKK